MQQTTQQNQYKIEKTKKIRLDFFMSLENRYKFDNEIKPNINNQPSRGFERCPTDVPDRETPDMRTASAKSSQLGLRL